MSITAARVQRQRKKHINYNEPDMEIGIDEQEGFITHPWRCCPIDPWRVDFRFQSWKLIAASKVNCLKF